jgi:NADH-quinone oxidoreductase subunit D
MMVRVEEVRQSARIMKQCLAKCPKARSRARTARSAAQARRDEELDGKPDPSLQALHRRLPRARRRVYVATESPKGEFGVYLVSDGGNKPYRCKIRPTAFSHLQAMDFMSKGHMLPDAPPFWARSTSCSGSATVEQPGNRRGYAGRV